jgi:uncharacterized membrane protein
MNYIVVALLVGTSLAIIYTLLFIHQAKNSIQKKLSSEEQSSSIKLVPNTIMRIAVIGTLWYATYPLWNEAPFYAITSFFIMYVLLLSMAIRRYLK